MLDSHKTLRHLAGILRTTQLTALLLGLVAGGLLWSEATAFASAEAWVEHSHEAIGVLNDTRNASLRAALALDDLMVRQSPATVRELRFQSTEALRLVRYLEELTVDNPPQQARARRIDAELRKTVGWVTDAADIGELGGHEALARVLTMRLDRDSTQGLREALVDMQVHEERLLRQRFAGEKQHLAWLERIAIVSGLGLAGFMLWSFRFSGRLVSTSHKDIEKLAEGSLQDPLTGLQNRRGLMQRIGALSDDPPLAVLAFDLDDFKPINDRLGHSAGDDVLRTVAERLREQCRDRDILARMGGDEFVVVLPGVADEARASFIAARLRLALQQPMTVGAAEVRVGVSLGWAVRGIHGSSFEALLAVADGRSYGEKHEAKRGRVVSAERQVA